VDLPEERELNACLPGSLVGAADIQQAYVHNLERQLDVDAKTRNTALVSSNSPQKRIGFKPAGMVGFFLLSRRVLKLA
jgi:hypothetical protein